MNLIAQMEAMAEMYKKIPSIHRLQPGETRKHGTMYTARPKNNVWISMDVLEEIRAELKRIGYPYRMIFRGPRYKKNRYHEPAHTRKGDAYYFIIARK